MNKKIVDYANSIVEKTGVTITADDIEENLTGSIENLVSFIPNSIGNLLLPVAILLACSLAGSVAIGYFKSAAIRGVFFFLLSLLVVLPGGLIVGIKRIISLVTKDIKGVIYYALDITDAVCKKAEQEQKKMASFQDTFALIICLVVLPAIEKVMDNLLGIIKFVLYGITEKILFAITKLLYSKLSKSSKEKGDSGEEVKKKSTAIEDIKTNIDKITKKGTGGLNFVLNLLLVLILGIGGWPLVVIVISIL